MRLSYFFPLVVHISIAIFLHILSFSIWLLHEYTPLTDGKVVFVYCHEVTYQGTT